MGNKESQLEKEYLNNGYKPFFSKECYETIEEDCKECEECKQKTMRYIGVKHKNENYHIAIGHCNNCGFEYEF